MPARSARGGRWPMAKLPTRHVLVSIDELSLFNSSCEHADGYSRAVCSCGWKSIPLRTESALFALFESHKRSAA